MMNNTKAIRVLQHCAKQEGFDLELDKFNKINETIINNKNKIFSMMGNRAIIEKEELTSIGLDDEIKELGYNQYLRLLIEIPYFKNLYVLRRFIRDCGAISFYNNKVSEDMSYSVTNLKNVEEIVRIPQGMKMTRALKFFTPGDDKLLGMLQTKYSQIINTSNIQGKMCISCDPMDFLTMSENNSGWRSCMALDGEYSAGTMSYALDNYSFIVYLKSNKENESLKGLPEDVKWNSKKWRSLIYFDTEYKTIVSTRQYPFTSTKLMKQAMEMIKSEFGLENWESKMVDSLYDLNTGVGSKGLIFNDLETYNSKVIIHTLTDKEALLDEKTVVPGIDVPCPKCNSRVLDYAGSFVCDCCANREICENCHGTIVNDDETYVVDGMTICEDCMSECCCVCECCYEAFWNDSDELVYTEDGNTYCINCYDGLD